MQMFDFLYPKHTAYNKYMILSRPRTGSSVLDRMLGKHKQVRGRGEMFNRLTGHRPEEIWNSLFTGLPTPIKAAGFKMHYHHPTDTDKQETWDLLTTRRDLHVIHIRRENILRMLVSGRITRKLKIYNIRFPFQRPPISKRRLEINREELLHAIKKESAQYNQHSMLFSAHPYFEVTYERLIKQPQQEFNRILDFLELSHQPPDFSLAVLNPEPLSELITNYDQLRSNFESTEWIWMFE